MNYKINIKCEIKNAHEELKEKINDLKNMFTELNLLYLTQNEKVAYCYKEYR